jgi:hypothetical protein
MVTYNGLHKNDSSPAVTHRPPKRHWPMELCVVLAAVRITNAADIAHLYRCALPSEARDKCGGARVRRIQMLFERCQGWRVTFRDPGDLRVRLRELTFADEGKVQRLVE